ncbi:MAG: ribosome biogenesis factor YjgA [Rubrivivax sp.]|nr:ribosome biogenesis factor YjgA [Rubrivivax sp.]
MTRRAAPHRGIDIHYGEDSDADGRPSKTQLKEKSHELQTLGADLAALSNERLAAIVMPDALREAIELYRRISAHEGRRRQMQYVGKLMRRADEAALREAVAAATLGTAQSALALHEAERWRAEMIAGDEALTRWIQAHPETDAQQLRSLVRAARRDAAGLAPEARQPKSFRELFQFIKPEL